MWGFLSMSRIAKNSVKIPSETSCKYENNVFFAKGKLGEMSLKINSLFAGLLITQCMKKMF